MTAPDFAAMTDAELGELVARKLGLLICQKATPDEELTVWRVGKMRLFDPANDLNHAAEFGAAFLAAHDRSEIVITYTRADWIVSVLDVGVVCTCTSDPSEARARTVAVLRAWHALKGDG